MRRIQLEEMAPHVHSFSPGENKVDKISKWLISWIVLSLQSKKVKPYDLLPLKSELAFHIGVSLGTVQNAFRLVEDAGYIESKQKVGSYIKDKKRENIKKLTSKKDMATDIIKTFLKEHGYEAGDRLLSTRKLAELTGVSNATIRSAVMNLVLQGILEKKKKYYVLTGRSYKTNDLETKTLAEKIAGGIQRYIKKELSPGDKLPPNYDLAAMFNVSVKTIHDAVKMLTKEGILYSRRGKYGTVVLDDNNGISHVMYNYENIEQKLRKKIIDNYNINDKLPSIKELAKEYKTSEKTVKKALDNLKEDGCIAFVRGRWGGTFVTDIPQDSKDAYTWIALNQNYIPN